MLKGLYNYCSVKSTSQWNLLKNPRVQRSIEVNSSLVNDFDSVCYYHYLRTMKLRELFLHLK